MKYIGPMITNMHLNLEINLVEFQNKIQID